MRVVFVHGINHQEQNSEWVVHTWLAALKSVLSPEDYLLLEKQEIVAPFYGEELFARTNRNSVAGGDAVPMSLGQADGEEFQFFGYALEEATKAYKISERKIQAKMPQDAALEQGFPHDRRIIAIASALESLSPVRGRLLIRLLAQAYVYLYKPQARQAIDAIVGPELMKGPCIVVGHSLGSVVAFNGLRKVGAEQRCPMFITIGSPLAIKSVQAKLGRPLARPDSVVRWVNAADKNDFITLGRILDQSGFGPNVENIGNVDNQPDHHDASKYLANREVAKTLVDAIKASA